MRPRCHRSPPCTRSGRPDPQTGHSSAPTAHASYSGALLPRRRRRRSPHRAARAHPPDSRGPTHTWNRLRAAACRARGCEVAACGGPPVGEPGSRVSWHHPPRRIARPLLRRNGRSVTPASRPPPPSSGSVAVAAHRAPRTAAVSPPVAPVPASSWPSLRDHPHPDRSRATKTGQMMCSLQSH